MDKANKSECVEEIEECMKALLNEYIYKSNKEFYVCSLAKILQETRKCFKQEKLCKNCKDIQIGGSYIQNNIIMHLLNEYKTEYKKIMMKYIIHICI